MFSSSGNPVPVIVPHSDEKEKILQDLTSRIQNLENAILYPQLEKKLIPTDSSIHEQVQRAYNSVVIQNNVYSSVFKWVPENYYKLTLAQRAEFLGAQSTWQLCKSMLMENKAFDESLSSDNKDGSYSRFYLIVLQYETTISNKKLVSEVRALKQPVTKRYETNKFDFRVASSEDNSRLTGYTHNAVSPFGLLEKDSVTIILSKSIKDMTTKSQTPFIWMGGGHVHCKVGMATIDFIDALHPLVLDVTEPKVGGGDDDDF